MNENKQAYISHVHLKGYKSIRDMEVDLLPGLNIIIGPNGSGKTNFLEFLDWILNRNHSAMEADMVEALIEYRHKKDLNKYLIKGYFGYYEGSDNSEQIFIVDEQIFLNQKEIFSTKNAKISNLDYIRFQRQTSNTFGMNRLTFANPIDLFMQQPLKLSLRKYKELQRYMPLRVGSIPNYFNKFLYSLIDINVLNKPFSIDFIQNSIFLREKASEFITCLSEYTPVKDVQILQKSAVLSQNANESISIENVFIQFKVNEQFLFWNQLSDGTKRLFYIICTVFFSTHSSNNYAIGVEEPELGIHPDQLYLLMDFLKEQSKEKQIIITTHSPEVMNILGKDELDRIIVTRYDAEKGTQMHKLSPHHIRKGQIYMKEVGHLSDFWVHSNLEEYEVEEN